MSFSSSSSGGSKPSFLNYHELMKKDLQPGDLIEIDRGSYNHWVMYADKSDNGTHWCFHVTTACGDFEKKTVLMSSARNARAALKKHKLKDILEDNDSKEPSKARINNKTDEAKRKKCTPHPIDKVIDELEKIKDEPVQYSVGKSNCEHYVTSWKYGARWSSQVEKVLQTSAIVATGIGIGIGVVALAGALFRAISGGSSESHQDDSDSD